MSGITTEAPDIPANDLVLAKEMADTLHRKYPGYMWAVAVQGDQGIADIRNLTLSGDYGYRLLLTKMYSMSEFLARVTRAGGEILERYRLSRGAANEKQIQELPRNWRGEILGDKTR